ncbi:lipid kinase [Microbulbifer sp. ALW1]|uniref:lipid kinase n=1 Tax=Microbulbifer sp. (strain ALW1) TaxID=1516059 RepID=UPI001F0193C7|nr:lipid kinase [Microbulbifer sp. ALW1]
MNTGSRAISPQSDDYRRALLIRNPGSRQGGSANLDAGLARLEAAGIQLNPVISESAAQSCEIIRQRCNDVDLVIIGGGDGTISSCARALLECKLPFAILPLGTANDLARSLAIESVEQAIAAICDGHTAEIDLGVVNDHVFFNVANLGLGVQVTEELTPEVKQRWGVFSYLKALVSAFARHRQFKVELQIDGERHVMRSIQLAVGNGRFYGGGNIVHQEATIDDDLLHLYSLRPQTFWELLTLAPLLRGGRHDIARRTFAASGRDIRISTGSKPMSIHADGEPVSETPAHFSVKPGALNVVVPSGSPLLKR